MAAGGRLGAAALAAGALLYGSALLSSQPAIAQANGDPGSALLGIARAQTNSQARQKSNANPEGVRSNPGTQAADPPKDPTQSAAVTEHHN